METSCKCSSDSSSVDESGGATGKGGRTLWKRGTRAQNPGGPAQFGGSLPPGTGRCGNSAKNLTFELGGAGFETSSATPVWVTLGKLLHLSELQLSGLLNNKWRKAGSMHQSKQLIAVNYSQPPPQTVFGCFSEQFISIVHLKHG